MSTSRNLSFTSAFSAKDRQLAERSIRERDERRRRANETRQRKAERIVEAARRQSRDLVGADEWLALRHLMQREQIAFRDLLQPPKGLRADYRKASDARVAKADAFLRKNRISLTQLRRIGRDMQAQLQEVLPATADAKLAPGYHLPQHLETWQKLSHLHDHAFPWGQIGPIDPGDGGWVLFRPPFFGFFFEAEPVTSQNFHVDWTHHLDPPAGWVGHDVTMDIDVVDDFDFASAQVDTEIAFGFEAPIAGPVEVLVTAQCINATHDLTTVNRWGWSDSRTGQTNYLMLDVLHPNVTEPSLAAMSTFSRDTAGDTHDHEEYLTRGAPYFANLITSGAVDAGQHIVVLVGTRSFDKCGANDVEIHSRSSFHWLITAVEVRIGAWTF